MTNIKAFGYGLEINEESNVVEFSVRYRDKGFIIDLMNKDLNLT